MYLAELGILNFRKLQNTTMHFQPGLNVLVGANNVGKTAVIDALRALLAGYDEPFPRLSIEDIHRPKGGVSSGGITFKYLFRGLSPDEEADFLLALKPGKDSTLDAQISVRYAEADKGGRLRVSRWCGDHEDVGITADMMENLRGVYLPPLRDASQGLKPSRTSQLARLLQLLADDPGREGINAVLKDLDKNLKKHPPIINTQTAISGRHGSMLGKQLAQALEVGLSANDFQRFSARLSLLVDDFEIEQNGLGFNNLIFMAVVLSELAKSPEAAYRGLIIEEPEAHLVTGGEPFLQGFKFNAGTFPQPISQLQIAFDDGQPHFYCSYHEQVTPLDRAKMEVLACRLGRTGAYTHSLGRYWCYRTLCEQPGILRALARRYPHILIDEAQDIGSPHQAILEVLADAGVQITLIGDPSQGIYEFAGADGRYLKEYAAKHGVFRYTLTKNYRSVPSILSLANALSVRADTADRLSASQPHGAFFAGYHKGQREHLIKAFRLGVTGAGLEIANSVVVCRGRKMADELSGIDAPAGQGIPRLLAQAAVLRDRLGDYSAAFKSVAAAVVALLATPPHDLLARITQPVRFPELRGLRREVWDFTRNSNTGLPDATLLADSEWHPALLGRLKSLLGRIETKFGLSPADNLGQKLSKKGLPSAPLMATPDLATEPSERLRVDTVHQVKGESLDAVLYMATKEHVQALLAGVDDEVGRIGYVAVTRAKDLFWLGVPANCLDEFRPALLARGFQEASVAAAVIPDP